MKLLSTLFLTVLCFFTTLNAKEIRAEVRFENFTERQLKEGLFMVSEADLKVEVNTLESFHLTLPKKGKYTIYFQTKDFKALVYYPSRITKKRNIITIVLQEKTKPQEEVQAFPIAINSPLNQADMLMKFEAGQLNFILHGLQSTPPDWAADFKAKYGVGIVIENCILDPLSFQTATQHNQSIFQLLEEKYGESWKKDLLINPFGTRIREK